MTQIRRESFQLNAIFVEQLLENGRLFLKNHWGDFCGIPPLSFHRGESGTTGPVLLAPLLKSFIDHIPETSVKRERAPFRARVPGSNRLFFTKYPLVWGAELGTVPFLSFNSGYTSATF